MANWLDRLSPKLLKMVLNLWPPFRCSGIKVIFISQDFRLCKVILKHHWYNRNYVSTHFGGTMFAMTDPFFMLILLRNLGKNYIVWDKAAQITYIKPGKGTISASFSFSETELTDIRNKADLEPKYVFNKTVEIFNAEGEIFASVVKTLFVKRKI